MNGDQTMFAVDIILIAVAVFLFLSLLTEEE